MPKRALSYEELYAAERERLLDQLARAQAGLEGRPPMSRRPSEETLAAAWNERDPAVTLQHLAEIAAATVAELGQEKDERGQPRWMPEDVEQEVKLRQTLAVYPYRAQVYSAGIPPADVEATVKAGTRAAKRYGRPDPLTGGGWSAPVEEAEIPGEEAPYVPGPLQDPR